jgi:hypothetical protein
MVGQLLNDLTNYDFVRSKCIQTYLSVVWWPYAMCTKKWHCNIEIYCWSITATIITVEKLLVKKGQNLLSENSSYEIIVGMCTLCSHMNIVWFAEKERNPSAFTVQNWSIPLPANHRVAKSRASIFFSFLVDPFSSSLTSLLSLPYASVQ